MLSLLILVFSGIALIRFAISQWRAIWISSAHQPVSDSLHFATGIDASGVGPGDFGRLLDLCEQLSPELNKTTPWLNEVSVYYRTVAKLKQICDARIPRLAAWASCEMETCSRYVAVVLDQNLAMNMDRQLAARSN